MVMCIKLLFILVFFLLFVGEYIIFLIIIDYLFDIFVIICLNEFYFVIFCIRSLIFSYIYYYIGMCFSFFFLIDIN